MIESEVAFGSLSDAATLDSVLSIGYWFKTTEGTELPWRHLIDSNIPAINANVEWDSFDEGIGYPLLSMRILRFLTLPIWLTISCGIVHQRLLKDLGLESLH